MKGLLSNEKLDTMVYLITICIMNVSGLNDLNILLFLTSPPFWLLETPWFSLYVIHLHYHSLSMYIIVPFWFILGKLLDRLTYAVTTAHKK